VGFGGDAARPDQVLVMFLARNLPGRRAGVFFFPAVLRGECRPDVDKFACMAGGGTNSGIGQSVVQLLKIAVKKIREGGEVGHAYRTLSRMDARTGADPVPGYPATGAASSGAGAPRIPIFRGPFAEKMGLPIPVESLHRDTGRRSFGVRSGQILHPSSLAESAGGQLSFPPDRRAKQRR